MARHGVRLDFFDLPTGVVEGVENILDSTVETAVNAEGGFTPGPAARCDLADGRTVFVKACGTELSERATAMHRQEAAVLASLPNSFPAPSILATVDVDNWFALVTEFIKGDMPAAPLKAEAVTQVLDLVEKLAAHGASCDVDAVAPVGTHELERSNRWAWKKIRDDGMQGDLDEWSSRHLGRLVKLEDDWVGAATGTNLLHRDLRTDNMIIGAGRSTAVDWPTASLGAAWIDLVGLLPAFHLDGAQPPMEIFDRHPVGVAADSASVDCYLAALAGYFTRQALLPPIPGIEGVRSFQADQGRVSRNWLAARLGWD